MITNDQQTALEAAAVRVIYFVEFQFLSATIRLSTANQTITWGGFEWLGLGQLGGISPIDESDGLESSSVNFTLNAAEQSWLALAVGAVEEYRGRVAKMYFCPLDDGFQPIDIPVQCWSGIMDTVSIGLEGENGGVTLKCETAAYGLKRRPALRINAAQQRKKHPTDSGFDYLNSIIAQPQMWLSRRFQQI